MTPLLTHDDLRHQPPTARQLIDVRSGSEFDAGHTPGAINIPMEQIEARLDDLPPNGPLVLICQSGRRARITAGLLEPCHLDIAVLEGGTAAWIQAGLPIVASTKTSWSLERQVRMGAGLLVLAGSILGLAVNFAWVLLCAFVGLGLTFAGLTDFCPMAVILEKLPWNARSHCKLELSKVESCADKQ